jgi:acetyl esterase
MAVVLGEIVQCLTASASRIRNAPFLCGYFAGFSSFALWMVYNRWNFKLSFLINVADILMDLLKPDLLKIGDNDIDAINLFRKKHTMIPMGIKTNVGKTESLEVSATDGYKIPCKVYTPKDIAGELRPIVVYIHGGGYVVGNAEFYEPATTFIAENTKCIVVGVNYRKAPENKFPCGVNDCMDVVKWLHQHGSDIGGDANRIAVMGDSAGGNLTIQVSVELWDLVTIAIPIYPGVIFGTLSNTKVRNSSAPILKAVTMDWFTARYFNSIDDLTNPRANPLYRSKEELARVPYTHIITAEFDCLLDEGELYYKHLKECGAKKVTYKQYNNTVHGFFGVQPFTHGKAAVKDVCELLNDHFQSLSSN